MAEVVKIEGLREFQAELRAADRMLPRQIRVVLNEAAQIVVDYAAPKIPRRTGMAVSSIKVRSTQKTAGVAIGGRKAPYYPWLDFGGEGRKVGRPAHRPFLKDGRYLYPALAVKREEFTRVMNEGLTRLAEDAGLEVT